MTRLLIVLVIAGMLFTPLVAAAGSFEARVSWGPVTGADSYVLEKKVGTGAFAQIATPTVPAYTESGLLANTSYCYRVAAKNSAMQTAFSAEACGTTGQELQTPGGVSIQFIYVQ